MTDWNPGAEHATGVTVAAERALDAWREVAPGDRRGDLDRRDLAKLLAAVGSAWTQAEMVPTSFREKTRWSAVCQLAHLIGKRLDSEMALARASGSGLDHIVDLELGSVDLDNLIELRKRDT